MMGSPITTWDGAEAYFTGFGGSTPLIILLVSVAVTAAALYVGHRHEKHAYDKLDHD